jgi:hypothetical protein
VLYVFSMLPSDANVHFGHRTEAGGKTGKLNKFQETFLKCSWLILIFMSTVILADATTNTTFQQPVIR